MIDLDYTDTPIDLSKMREIYSHELDYPDSSDDRCFARYEASVAAEMQGLRIDDLVATCTYVSERRCMLYQWWLAPKDPD